MKVATVLVKDRSIDKVTSNSLVSAQEIEQKGNKIIIYGLIFEHTVAYETEELAYKALNNALERIQQGAMVQFINK